MNALQDRRNFLKSTAALAEEMKGFHWMMSYGSYLRECGYALKKMGVDFLNVSRA